MGKKTIGYFRYKDRKYNIYMLRGYKGMKNWVYIGNATFNYFIRFHLHKDLFYIYNPRYVHSKEYNNQKMIKLSFPKREGEIKEMLEALFKPEKMELLELSKTSRYEVIGEILLDAI